MKKLLSAILCGIILLSVVNVGAKTDEELSAANDGSWRGATWSTDDTEGKAAFNSETESLRRKSTDRWSSVINSYVYDNDDSTFCVVDNSNNKITVSTYGKNDYAEINKKEIPFELEKFGGFYSGKKYNYIVFGQDNTEEDNNKEVIRIVKYDKNFNRISQASVRDCYTIYPFSSSLRMCESGNTMFIHTSRTRYQTDDGLNHQSQLTIILDTDKMTVKNFLGDFQENHVSHSFNQFVIHDGDTFVLLDHGDGYPRSVVLNKYDGIDPEEWQSEYYGRTVLKYTSVDLFKIPGAVGANCTGVTVGGFECSDNNYLAAINTVDHSKVTGYTSFEMYGLDKDERDIVLLISGKNNTDSAKVKQVRLTNYIGKNKFGSTPYLVKLSNDRFLVLWQEFEYTENRTVNNGIKYVQTDGDGNVLSDVRTESDFLLSSDCQPVKIDNNLVWYIDIPDKRKFYTMNLDTALVTVTINGNFVTFDQSPIIINGCTLVPVRAIFEALGTTVEWDEDTQTVTSKRGNVTITLTIGSNIMYKNGTPITLDVPAQIVSDRTLVPVRAIAEAFDCNVDWNDNTQTVIITE